MRAIIDAEFDSLTPTKLWCVVCKDVATEKNYVFRFDRPGWETKFRTFAKDVQDWVGLNNLVFDSPAINFLMGGAPPINLYRVIDLLIVSHLVWYARPGGHSVKAWGKRFDMVKPEIAVYDDPTMIDDYVDRCEHDVEIQFCIYKELLRFIDDPEWKAAIDTEHEIQRICMDMEENGFSFDIDGAKELLATITKEMAGLEDVMQQTVPPFLKQDGVVKLRRNKDGQVSKHTRSFNIGTGSFSSGSSYHRFSYEPFNPGSAKHRIELLNRSGWEPIEKTKGHITCERDLKHAQRFRLATAPALRVKLDKFKKTGWKVNEDNLDTLPPDAPQGARCLAQWLSLEGRRADLAEWMAAYNPVSGRIHGNFNGIGAWTHRMSHRRPNQGNIFRVFSISQCKDQDNPTPVENVKIAFNGVLRGLWRAEPGAYLVGADAEGIQLRVLAHLIDCPDYRHTIESGRKEDKTDIHNVNMRALSPYCLSRDDAKTFIYAWILNAASPKIGQILQCTPKQARDAIGYFLGANPALKEYKLFTIPAIANRGYFVGLDGRKVMVPNAHKVLAGELQNGESTIMKHATILWRRWALEDGLRYKGVDLVHDEWQSEVYDEETGHRLGQLKCDALVKTGRDLGVRCNLAGEYNIGRNWLETH